MSFKADGRTEANLPRVIPVVIQRTIPGADR